MPEPVPSLPSGSREILSYLYDHKEPKGITYGRISMQLFLGTDLNAEELGQVLIDHELATFTDNRLQITETGISWVKQLHQFQEDRIFETLLTDYNFTLLRFLYDENRALRDAEIPTILADHAPRNTKGYASLNLHHMLEIELKAYIERKDNMYQLNSSGRRFVEMHAQQLNIILNQGSPTVNQSTPIAMKQSTKLDLILRFLYEKKFDGGYYEIADILEELGVQVSHAEAFDLGKRLEEDGLAKINGTKSGMSACLTSHGVDYIEDDSYTYAGHSVVTNTYNISVSDSPNTSVLQHSPNSILNQTYQDSHDIFTPETCKRLESWGVTGEEINDLKTIVETNKKDKPQLREKAMKWMGGVLASAAGRGLYEHLPALTDFIQQMAK